MLSLIIDCSHDSIIGPLELRWLARLLMVLETDKLTDKRTDRQDDRLPDRQKKDKQINRIKDSQMARMKERQTDRWMDRFWLEHLCSIQKVAVKDKNKDWLWG